MDFDSSISSHQSIFLNSWHFILIALFGVAWCKFSSRFVRTIRQIGILILNVYFLSLCIKTVESAAVLAGFLVLTYLLGYIKAKFHERISDAHLYFIVFAYWIFLFLVKDPDLMAPLNPFFHFSITIIGISYLAFRAISYIYESEDTENSFISFVCYMTFFPTLLAGPIERFEKFDRQWEVTSLSRDATLDAVSRILTGFIKKFVVADNLMVFCAFAYKDPTQLPIELLWVSVMLQLVVLYWDFSGYCDIAIGVSKLMGFEISENFNNPFLARNVQEFWTRWHITMTSFIRDYIFTPIVISATRKFGVKVRQHILLVAYFFCLILISLWHATTWGFVVFGLTHGVALVVWQFLVKDRINLDSRGAAGAARVVNYMFVSTSMLFWYFGPSKTLVILAAMFGVG
jgi:alginate O-acetyltransferase complex protein AlgI